MAYRITHTPNAVEGGGGVASIVVEDAGDAGELCFVLEKGLAATQEQFGHYAPDINALILELKKAASIG